MNCGLMPPVRGVAKLEAARDGHEQQRPFRCLCWQRRGNTFTNFVQGLRDDRFLLDDLLASRRVYSVVNESSVTPSLVMIRRLFGIFPNRADEKHAWPILEMDLF